MNNNKYDISSVKRVTGKFLEVLRCGRSKQRQSNLVPRGLFSGFGVGEKPGKSALGTRLTAKKCTKKVCCTCKVVFLLIRPIVVFSPFSLSSPLSITRFYILFEQTINIIESFAFSPS